MKKVTLILLSIIFLGLTSTFAQKPFVGTVKSKISIQGTDDPNILSQIPESTTTYLYGNYTKTVMELVPGAVNLINITNGDAKKMYTIFDITGMGKYYIETDETELKEKKANIETKFQYTGEKKTIAGYNCEKVIETVIDNETDEETTAILYVTKDFYCSSNINLGSHDGLEGYPLYVEAKTEMNGSEVTQIIEAIEVTPSKKIKLAEFLVPADGIKTTMEDMMKLFGGGGDDDE